MSQDGGRPRLAISTSGHPSCALLLTDGSVRAATTTAPDRGALLHHAVSELLRERGVAPRELGGIDVDVGPGSYTGLRVAVTFARTALAFGDIPIRTATSFELLAVSAARLGIAGSGDRIRPVLVARRARYHTASLVLGQTIDLVEPPRALDAARLVAAVGAHDLVLAEAGLVEELGRTTRARRVGTVPAYSAEMLFDSRIAPRPAELEDLDPLYLMGSYAEHV
jgi:tRNA threonylcarbamoyl adenosine modification protein YeaZ